MVRLTRATIITRHDYAPSLSAVAEPAPTSLEAWRAKASAISGDESPEANATAHRDISALVERGDWTAAIPYVRVWLNVRPFRIYYRAAGVTVPIEPSIVSAATDTAIWRALSSPRFSGAEPERCGAWLVAWLYGSAGREGAIQREARASYSGECTQEPPDAGSASEPSAVADPGHLDLEPKPAALFAYWWSRVQDDAALTVPQAARELWPGSEHRLARWEASRRIRRASRGIVLAADGPADWRKRRDGGKCSPGGFGPDGDKALTGGARLRWPNEDGRKQGVSLAWAERAYISATGRVVRVSAWSPAPYLLFRVGEPVRRIRPKATGPRRRPTWRAGEEPPKQPQ